jgi:hypothetical protein
VFQVTFRRALELVSSADILLWRPTAWWGRAIAVAGRGPYSHAAMAAWWDDTLMAMEMTAFGGRAVTLESQVRRYPGRIDVYQANPCHRWPEWEPARAVACMRRFCGVPYGWRNLLGTALLHVPGVRFLVPAQTDDQADRGRPPFCSQAIAAAGRAAGVDPVQELADCQTEPADLARSPFYAYLFTLIP